MITELSGKVYASAFFNSRPLEEQHWGVNGWVVFANNLFVHVNGASMVFPSCDIPFRERSEMVEYSLYHTLQRSFVAGDVIKESTKLAITELKLGYPGFHCMRQGFGIVYGKSVDESTEKILLHSFGPNDDPREDRLACAAIGRENLDFFVHMFGKEQCMVCRTFVESERAKRRVQFLSGYDWITFRGAFEFSHQVVYC